MSIKREDLDAGRIDLADVTTGRRIAPTHPGEILRDEGRLEEAIAVFEGAVELHDEVPYTEPEVLNFSARHWLGAALLEAERAEAAEEVYRAALVQHPNNGWSIYGLEQALRAQGRLRSGRTPRSRRTP